MSFKEAATIWMSISAMNWPNAMTAKIRYLRAFDQVAGSPAAAGTELMGNVMAFKRGTCQIGDRLYDAHHITGSISWSAMRYDTEHKQRTRERVLKAAAKAIRAQGPHRVAVASVMSRAGLTHGGFYAHFDSKDALVAAAIGQMFDEARGNWERLTREQQPGPALALYIDFYLSSAHRDAVSAGCPIPILAPELRRLGKPAREQFAAGVARLTERLRSQLASLDVADAQDEASSMLAEMIGALALARAEPDAQRSDAILAASRQRLKARIALGDGA